MEDRTRFNLEKSIEVWKERLSKGNMSGDNIFELEDHLYDEISTLQGIGLSEEEAFMVAKNRMGDTAMLSTEFGKVNRDLVLLNRLTPYLKGVLYYLGFLTVAKLSTNISALIFSKLGLDNAFINHASIGVLLLLTIAILVIVRKKYRNINLDLNRVISIPVLAGVIIVGRLLTFLTLPSLTHSIGLSGLGQLQLNLSVYDLLYTLFILIISCIVSYHLKQQNKVEVAV